MFVRTNALFSVLLGVALCALASTSTLALPALQLGPGSLGNWSYNSGTQTWETDTTPFSVNAYANANPATYGSGVNGNYAWDPAGAGTQYGYLVVAATPQINFDGFDVTVSNDGSALSLYASGYGSPPLQDPNSLAPHGIFSTYFEIYQFAFDGAVTTISDTQPGQTGSGLGHVEELTVTVNSFMLGVNGLHIDLFSVEENGILDLASSSNSTVKEFAPFSHDVENTKISEPAPLAVLGFSLFALSWIRRRRAA